MLTVENDVNLSLYNNRSDVSRIKSQWALIKSKKNLVAVALNGKPTKYTESVTIIRSVEDSTFNFNAFVFYTRKLLITYLKITRSDCPLSQESKKINKTEPRSNTKSWQVEYRYIRRLYRLSGENLPNNQRPRRHMARRGGSVIQKRLVFFFFKSRDTHVPS